MTIAPITAVPTNGFDFGNLLGGVVKNASDLFMIDWMSKRGVSATPTEQRREANPSDDIAGVRKGFNFQSPIVVGGGILLVGLVIFLAVKK